MQIFKKILFFKAINNKKKKETNDLAAASWVLSEGCVHKMDVRKQHLSFSMLFISFSLCYVWQHRFFSLFFVILPLYQSLSYTKYNLLHEYWSTFTHQNAIFFLSRSKCNRVSDIKILTAYCLTSRILTLSERAKSSSTSLSMPEARASVTSPAILNPYDIGWKSSYKQQTSAY